MGGRKKRQVKRSAPKILLALVATTAAATAACSAAPEPPPPQLPGLSLASSAPAQTAFRPVLRRWVNAMTREERAAVEPDLAAFVAKFPDDGKVPAAEALLAWIAVEKGDLVAARRLSRGAANLGPGSWQDFSFLVDGAIKTRRGEAAAGLAILEKLVSTLIDPWARDLLNEELIAAAIKAKDAKLAVKVMSVWLREAGDDEQLLVRSRVERALGSIADPDLIRIFDERAALARNGPDGEIDPLLAKRLAEIAIAARDAVLAKKLLATSGGLLGDRGDAVARLAAGAAAIRIDARTVGLLLSFRTTDARRRSAEVASGVAWGLELPGSGARLAVRNDAGDAANIDAALTELGRDGAAVIIAGIADDDARAAAKFAGDQRVPVILITRPGDLDAAAAAGPRLAPAPQGAESYALVLGASPQAWPPRSEDRLGAWIASFGSRPSFWAAAGRDAAVIAKRSVRELPQAATEDVEEVKSRRRAVRDALAQPFGDPLWTVESAPSKP
jgi:hypothetical protein